jgi:actin-like ATPase involved in cell morphogenesis
VVISPSNIELLKTTLGSALAYTSGLVELVKGRTVEQGEPVTVEVSAELVNTAMGEVVASTVRLIQECLADAPPDLSQDVSARGLNLVGGNARLNDFAELIGSATGVEVLVAPEPEVVVIRGLLMCLEEMSSLHALFRSADR